VNLQKSSIFFGNKCQDSVNLTVKDKLEVSNEVFQDTYLGMPMEIVRATTVSFKFLSGRVWKRASSCSGRPLSRASKEVWLKSVVQAIPNHIMSRFQVSVSTCDKMRRSIADHWWGFEDGCKKMHWSYWEWLSSPKSVGVWVLDISASSTRQCLPNSVGG
jgi:hypothetical protein